MYLHLIHKFVQRCFLLKWFSGRALTLRLGNRGLILGHDIPNLLKQVVQFPFQATDVNVPGPYIESIKNRDSMSRKV